MNKKILTKVLSFVLVICMLVPIIPNLGLDLLSVKASAATLSGSSILFKTGSEYYWKSGTKSTTTYPAPFYSSGSYYVSVSALNAAGAGSFEATTTVNGEGFVKVTNGGKLGTNNTYISSMGFIQITSGTDSITNLSDSDQDTWIKNNVYDHSSNANAFTETLMQNNTNNFDHPYLLADQAEFDHLKSVWEGTVTDATLKGYLNYLVGLGQSTYDRFFEGGNLKAEYASGGAKDITKLPTNVTIEGSKYDAYGYDVGGRQSYSVSIAQYAERLAYAYQITRDTKYSDAALVLAKHLSNWNHWGSGHFLNAADTSYHMALVYDWCYDAWSEADRNVVRDALFIKGVMAGVYDSIGNDKATYDSKANIFSGTVTNKYRVNPWYNKTLGGGSAIYNTRENNWNGVCSSGMIMAALAVMSEDQSTTSLKANFIKSDASVVNTTLFDTSLFMVSYKYNSSTKTYTIADALSANGLTTDSFNTMRKTAAWLINNNVKNLETYGFAQYIPDGSYVESASYWSYGTNSIFRTIACLEQTCGTTFGLSAAGGLDKTMYFSYYAQSSDGLSWRYHDDGGTSIDTGVNALYGSIIGDEAAVAYRKYLVEKGVASPSVYDTFNYDANLNEFDRMPLDYLMKSIEGYTMRDTWEKDSIYVAFQGGKNYVNHGQIDSGAFVYHNNGTTWFQDIGPEEYNAYEFGYGTQTIQNKDTFSSGNTMYYPNTAEGNNTLVSVDTTNTPFGQKWGKNVGAVGTISKYGSTDHGSYAVLDQTSVYNASSAQRGILMTNDRKTVVIQDEITYKSSTKSYWVGHLGEGVNVELSSDGKTAYLNDGKSTIRVSIVGNDSVKFQVMTGDKHLLGNTAANDYSSNQGSTASKDFSMIQKLVIEIPATTSLNLAVVIEEVTVFSSDEVGYKWTSMSSWNTSTPSRDESQYDDKLLLSKDFDIDGIGSFVATTGNLKFANTFVDGDNAMGAYFNKGNVGASKMTLTSAPAKSHLGFLGNGLVVTEFDIYTTSKLPAGVKFELYGTDIYPIVSVDASTFGTPSEWTHVTIVIDEATDVLYVFVGDELAVKDESFESKSYKDLKLVISTPAGEITEGDMFLDNVLIRTFSDMYTGLDSILAGTAKMSDWVDGTKEIVTEFDGNIAKLWYTEITAPDADDDTPIVDFWTDAVIVSTNDTKTEAVLRNNPGELYVKSFAELESAINSGSYTDVELYTGNANNPINITLDKRITVDTNGHDFYATADHLICDVNGDINTYKKGTLQVKLVINGASTKVTYTNTKLVSYNVPASAIGRLVERDNGDGTFTYVVTEANTWSATPYGNPDEGYALLATSENNTFYLTGNPYTGIFVTVNGNVVTAGGEDPAAFFAAIAKGDADFDKISVTNDFYFDSSEKGGGEAVRGNKQVYLNGHTITYYSSISSDHMFAVQAGNQIHVYGPGTIDNDATAANVIYKADGHQAGQIPETCTFNNLDIVTTYQICDVREGTVEFNNCNATAEAYVNLFGVSNYSTDKNGSGNRGTNYTTIEEHLGTLVLNGGTMTNNYASGYRGVVALSNNSRLVLKGGVKLVTPKSYGAVVLEHSAPSRDTSKDATGMDLMRIQLGDVYYSAHNLYVYNASAEKQLTETQLDSKVNWIEGASFTSPEALAATGYSILDGYVLAKTGIAGYAYQVVALKDAATVTWAGANQEYWVEGSTPTHTANNTASNGKKTTYDRSVLAGKGVVGGMSYNFEAVEVDDVELRVSLSLYSDFSVNVYVEQNRGVEFVKINGKTVSSVGYKNISGKKFDVYVLSGIAPQYANELITVTVGVGGKEISAVTSIVNYAAKLLASSTTSEAEKKLMYSIVNYIAAGAAYAGDYHSEASCKALLADYAAFNPGSDVNVASPDLNNIKSAIKSVYLDLAGAPTYAFKFISGFNGTVTFTYNSLTGGKVSETVEISNGKVVGTDSNVFMLSMKAYDMAGDLTITVNGASSIYNLDTYYTQAIQDRDALYNLIVALKGYCDAAKAYKA